MFKVIHIEGKPIKMKSDGGTARLYRQYFKKDYFLEIDKIQKNKAEVIGIYDIIENLAWVMAKRADDSIPEIDEWLGSFKKPTSIIEKARDIYALADLQTQSIVKPKKKNHPKNQ